MNERHGRSFAKTEAGLAELTIVVKLKEIYLVLGSLNSISLGDDERLYNTPLANGSCIFKNTDPAVASFYNDLEIRENYVEFPAGTTIISR